MAPSKAPSLLTQKKTKKDPAIEKLDILIKKMDILNKKMDILIGNKTDNGDRKTSCKSIYDKPTNPGSNKEG